MKRATRVTLAMAVTAGMAAGVMARPDFPEIDGKDGLNFAGWAKKLTGATTISVGSVGLSSDMVAAFLSWVRPALPP